MWGLGDSPVVEVGERGPKVLENDDVWKLLLF